MRMLPLLLLLSGCSYWQIKTESCMKRMIKLKLTPVQSAKFCYKMYMEKE